jgi:hypothetical protein
VVGIAAAELLQFTVSAAVVTRHRLATATCDLPLTALMLGSALAGHWAGSALAASDLAALLVSVASVTALWLPVGWRLLRGLRSERALFAV